MNPSIWGSYFWKVIHFTALGYPKNPTETDKDVYVTFYRTIGKILPCEKCSKNYKRHFENIPIDFFLESRKTLFKWTVHLHNTVNKELGKPQWSQEFAESHYMSLINNQNAVLTQRPMRLSYIFIPMIILFILVVILLFFTKNK